jgi:two-component system, NarL family, sensor kinase
MRNPQLRLIIILLPLIYTFSGIAVAQNPAPDSLKIRLELDSDNNSRLKILNQLCTHYVHNDLQQATTYAIEAERMLQSSTPPSLRGDVWYSRTITTMTLDSGIYYVDLAIAEYMEAMDSINLAEAYNAKAEILADYGKYTEALPLYQKALDILERGGKRARAAYVISNIALVYNDMYNEERSAEYSLKALEIFREVGDTNGIASTLLGMTEYYFSINDTANVFATIEEEIVLYHYLQKPFMVAYVISNLADALMDYRQEYDEALRQLFKALEMCDTTSANAVIHVNILRKIARAYIFRDEPQEALRYARLAVAATDSSNEVTVMYNELLLLYIYIELKDPKNALQSLENYRTLSEKMHSQQIEEGITSMQVRYETLKKENQILMLEEEKRAGRLYLIGLGGLFLAAMVVAALLLRSLRDRRKIAEQELQIRERKIRELEQSRRLAANESVIEGAEKERKRIARDLHDGLGGLLTGLRFTLNTVKGNYVTTYQTGEDFDKAIDMLDQSIGELRRVARNMMPESLLKLGLRDALEDYCITLGHDKPYSILFSSFGESIRIPARYETGIYRIAQELINNAIRHSGADTIETHLVFDSNRIHLTVSDNGKGFNPSAQTSGTGLAGIRSRCESLGGILTIDSTHGAGTEVSAGFSLDMDYDNPSTVNKN